MQQVDAQVCAMDGSGMGGSAACDANANESLYRSVERQYKAAATAAAAPKRGRRSKHAAKAAAAYTCEQDYATEMERWKADTIDCATPTLDNNTEANRARIRPLTLSLPSPPPAAAPAPASASEAPSSFDSHPPVRWLSPSARLYAFSDLPGFLVLRGALDPNAQAWWAWRCLQHYSRAEHTNLTNLAQLAQQQQQAGKEAADGAEATGAAATAACSTSASSSAPAPSSSTCPAGAASTVAAVAPMDAWHRYCTTGDTTQLHKLRWSSLGYHYDWSARNYTPSARSAFPPELAALSSELAAAAAGAAADGFEFSHLDAEAAIVNFYPSSACMGAHVDDAELTKLRPIVSVSLGCTAVFMLGGPSKDKRPTGVYLRAGDVAIMGGESRVCFHGVPRILDCTFGTPPYDPRLADITAPVPAHAAAGVAATPTIRTAAPEEVQEERKDAGTAISLDLPAPSPSPSPSGGGGSSSEGEEQSGHEKKKQRHEGGCRSVELQTKTPPPRAVAAAVPARSRAAEWSAERYYEQQLRFHPLPTSDAASTSSSATPAPAAATAPVPVFPACLPHPTRVDLLRTFRYLRHARLNINVRQVEDEHFTYQQGFTSHACRSMTLAVQQQRQKQATNSAANPEP